MAKVKTSYVCRDCGNVQPKWMGKCPDCGAWDALQRFTEHASAADAPAPGALVLSPGAGDAVRTSPAVRRATPIAEVKPLDVPRISTGIAEFDRVLGGGLVPGSVSLLGGDPGIGKSTLLLQAAAALAGRGHRVLYATSEESAAQVKLRADRLEGSADVRRGEHLLLLAEPNLAVVAEEARRTRPDLLVLDSIQLAYRGDIDAVPGSLQQLRRCCLDLVTLAKTTGTAVAVVGHVTKEGDLAGPKLLEHLVDVVLAFEGDRHHAYRVVRAVKNRFGSTQELGLFEMTGGGLAEVEEASLAPDAAAGARAARRAGTIFAPVLAGSRVLVAEIQALTATGFLGAAKRRASGLDGARLAMLIAVLEKHGGLRLADQDVYASVLGGVRITEPAADLPVALAVAGAFYGRAPSPATAALGEIALSGEVRAVRQLDLRVQSAVRRGARTLLVPASQSAAAGACVGAGSGVHVLPVGSVGDGIAHLS
ncbi:MAG: DNA repair protein RadA [Planctomycetota bacterium]